MARQILYVSIYSNVLEFRYPKGIVVLYMGYSADASALINSSSQIINPSSYGRFCHLHRVTLYKLVKY